LRKHAITEYKSVLELLGKQPGCPVCAFLKNEQASLLQRGSDSSDGLCNAHAWGFAAVGDADVAAPALLRSLEQVDNPAERSFAGCWLCNQLRMVEDRAISDLSSGDGVAVLMAWLKDGGAFCASHAAKLQRSSELDTARLIEQSDSRKRSELITTLRALTSPEGGRAPEQAGALGRAAEYLVSQRGLPSWQDPTPPPQRPRRKSTKSRG
jgi:hypothetical protein